ncbi:MAG TPA: hypothetical protein VJL33_01040 [Candidatus Bathyarchaeia archaeon]|nr:hypothetical protein [Candidatus Bathyarchaeia archaeon]
MREIRDLIYVDCLFYSTSMGMKTRQAKLQDFVLTLLSIDVFTLESAGVVSALLTLMSL